MCLERIPPLCISHLVFSAKPTQASENSLTNTILAIWVSNVVAASAALNTGVDSLSL